MTAPAPGSRWRESDERRRPGGAVNRVREAQAHARSTLRLSLAFLVAAAVAAVAPGPGGSWLPLHLFLAGAAVLAISATTVFFTVTWSAAPAPAPRLAAAQRWLVAGGAAGVSFSRAWSWPSALLLANALLFAAGLALLAALLAATVRRGVERRYDVAVAWYVAALAAGLVAAGLGADLGAGSPGPGIRPSHVALNVLGLVGLVLGGTLPSFAATVGRSRMWPGATPRRHLGLLGWQAAALVGAVTGFLGGIGGLAAAGLAAYALGLAALAVLAPRITARQLRWAGPRLLALHAGLAWWAVALLAGAVQAAGGDAGPAGRALHVLAVGGLAQILWGSLCYLLPVLRGGGHERLAAGFATTRSWTAFAAVNLGAAALTLGLPVVAGVTLAWFTAESAVRFGRVLRRPS